MRRILAGVRGDSGVRGDAELERLIRGATDTAYDASALPPYSAPIQFAVQRMFQQFLFRMLSLNYLMLWTPFA